MAIKDLFSKQKSQEVQFRGANQKSLDEFKQDIESGEEIKQIRIEDSLVVPDLNYASASSFVKYGSAKKYYEDAIKRIYNQYPYDGSNAEKIAFKNEVTQLERYILDNEYPKSTGFAVFSPDGYGTTGSNNVGFYSSSLPEFITAFGWKKDQVWNTGSSQQQSFRLDFTEGRTVEFWFKKGSFPAGAETIFDIRDTVNASASFGAYMLNTFNTNNLFCYYNNAVASNNVLFNLSTGLGSNNTDWHHYAIVYEHNDSDYTASLYIDGQYQSKATSTKTNVAQTGSLKLTLGALGGDFYNTASLPSGYGKLSGSLDEFRFWQEKRDAQQIGRNYFTVVNGGGNTDKSKINKDNPLKLSCYFKFNEGKTGVAATDSVVLDYSGRLANGAWTGYVANSRDTGSAIIQSSAGTEVGDPIIYSSHPQVITLSSNLEASGTQHDAQNVGSLQNSIPLWMLDEDQTQGGELKNLLQIMGSYLDSLYLQVSQISKFQEAKYQTNNNVSSNPYNSKLLTSLGFDIPEMFVDNKVIQTILNQDDEREFEDKLNEIKNLIYKNIYNNLSYINKSKGTVKAIRNLLRCYGVDDDLFNFNIYANNAEYVLQDDFKNSSIKFDSLDLTPFASTQNTEGVIFNFAETGNANSSPYISGSTDDYVGFSVEANAIFPKTPPSYQDSVNLTTPAIVTASVFGTREANFTNQTTVVAPDAADISVRVIKNDNTAKFQLSSSMGVLLESERFYDVYDNSRWNLSARVKYQLDPFSDIGNGAGYKLEFNGYNYEQDILQNSFALTASLSTIDGAAFIGADKRVYAGAEKTNITGALAYRANMKLLSVLAWADYIEDDELKSHARDITSFGRKEPYDNTFTFTPSFDNQYIPRFDTLAMNLAFNQVTSSDSSGEFTVPDLSSGSVDLISKYGTYSKIVGYQNTAKGKGFATSADVKDIQYLNISTQQIPENLNTDNMIQILENDDDLFFLDNRPVKYFFSLEASMYDTISREMLKTFAGVLDLASMVGSPLSEYQTYNKELRIARENFFSRVENQPSLEKYVNLYKFLDSAIEGTLFNLIPASADTSDRVRTVIENHILERPGHKKHLYPGKSVAEGNDTKASSNPKAVPSSTTQSTGFEPKVPVKCCKQGDTDCQSANPNLPICKTTNNTTAIDLTTSLEINGDLSVNKKNFQPYLIPLTQQAAEKANQFLNKYTNKRFTEADDHSGTSGWFAVIAERQEAGLVAATDANAKTRNSSLRNLKNVKILDTGRVLVDANVDKMVLYGSQRVNQDGNIILPIMQAEKTGDILVLTKIEQPIISQELAKNFADFTVSILNSNTDTKTIDPKQLPIRFAISGSGEFFPIGEGAASIIGHHLDTYYGNDLSPPAQGTFTERHVGGFKHRHTQIGQTSDRPELYKVEPTGSNEVRIFSPRQNIAGSTYNMHIPRVKFSREELVKRHYNTKNIETTTGSAHDQSDRSVVGNFDFNYEVVNLNGRKENNIAFVQQGGFNLTGSESTAVSGVIDFTLPDRSLSNGKFNKTVIVNRFSSPGEVATLSEGYLDVDAAEYSPYNALPYRNREIVNNLNSFLRTPSAFGGLQSGSNVTASFHKIQRNRINRIKYNTSAAVFTGSSFDNGFVINNIPRKDFGYWWISSSAQADLSMDGVYGFATSSTGIVFETGALRGINNSEFINFAGISTPPSKIGTSGFHYEVNADENLLNAPLVLTNRVTIHEQSASIYFLNINGPYGYPSFKQTRTGQHPVARYLTENNFIISETGENATRVNHSPLSSKYKPVFHSIKSQESIGGEKTEKDILLKYTFGNNYDFYGNYYDSNNDKLDNPFSKKHFDIVDKTDSLFYALSNMHTRRVNAVKLNSMVYNETIYPKETNTYLSKVRDRSRFKFNWRDSLSNRLAKINGSQEGGGFQTYSMWSMDVDGDNIGDATKRGELVNRDQDTDTQAGSIGDLNVRFGRYYLSGSTGYVNITASLPRNTVHFGTADSAQQGPFDDGYPIWNSDLRLIAKDHSILPEYRISEHIENIIDDGYDISNDRYQSLSLTGSQATSNDSVFLETFVNSDDIPAIEIVRQVQERDANRISLKLSAAKKLLPYDGFYPSQRTLQLSTLFSQSIAPDSTLTGSPASFQTLNNVVFSRLTYGSIRAGVAIDSANWISGSVVVSGEVNNSNNVKWNRIPFEAIVDPASYLNATSSIIENDFENFFNSTASVGYIDPKYGLAASNFYAGVVDTFVENSILTSIKSKPSSEWTFSEGNFTNYSMDIVISKKANFTNHDDPSANGFPYVVHAAFYQPLTSSNDSNSNWFTTTQDVSITRTNGKIAPNASWGYNEAIVTINFDYNNFKNVVTDKTPTLNDILFYSTKTYKNKEMVRQQLPAAVNFGRTTGSNSRSPFMTIEAGVDLFASNNQGQWTPTLKWECPTHNYVGVTALYPNGTDGGNGTTSGSVNRGVWHQYSTDTNSGLKLFARGPESETARTTGSLADAVGFEREQKVVSQLATSTQLKEYLVAIPFIVNECQEEAFFHYTTREFEEAYKNIGTDNRSTLTQMLELQRQMILPPKLNYMAKRDASDKVLNEDDYGPVLPPFAMYAFEITENLTQEDLSKWWQGVLPSAGTKVSMETFNINHEIKAGEIISPSVLNNDIFGGKLPKEMRFKIFKAKYRRNLTYNEVKNKSIYGTEPVNSIFGYNYPHDFYSLVEMAKIDLGLEYDGDEE